MIKPAACLASRAKRQPRRKPVTSWACSSARWFPHPHECPLLAKQDARLAKGSSAGCALIHFADYSSGGSIESL